MKACLLEWLCNLPRVRALYFIQFDDGFCLLCLSQGVEFFDEKLNALFMAWLLDHGIYPVSTFYLYHVLVHCMSYWYLTLWHVGWWWLVNTMVANTSGSRAGQPFCWLFTFFDLKDFEGNLRGLSGRTVERVSWVGRMPWTVADRERW